MPMLGIENDIITSKSKDDTCPPGKYCVRIKQVNTPDQANFKSLVDKVYQKGKKQGKSYDMILVTLEVDGERHSDWKEKWLSLRLWVTKDLGTDYAAFKEYNGMWINFLNHSGYMQLTGKPNEYPTGYDEIKANLKKFVGLPLVVTVTEEPSYNDTTKLVNDISWIDPWNDAPAYVPKPEPKPKPVLTEEEEEEDDLPF